jgi:purine-nucleoside phosphorylase
MNFNVSPHAAAARLQRVSRLRPKLAIVLGSGFCDVLTALRVDGKISYGQIPGFPVPSVTGHAGEVIFGWIGEVPVLVLSGRAHYYEGHSMEQVTFPIRTLAASGVHDLLLTNAAGGIHKKFRTGDFMVLTDHINFMGANPLRAGALPDRPRFVDMTQVYDSKLSALLVRAGKSAKLRLYRGVYLAVSGPSYETPAEIRAFTRLGADAVGMSTVPEAMVARQCELNVAAVSCITNPAAGMGKGPLSHVEVLKTGNRMMVLAVELLKKFTRLYGQTDKMRRQGVEKSPL